MAAKEAEIRKDSIIKKEKFTVSHGSKKHEVYVEVSAEKKPTLQDLAEAIAKKCGVPAKRQKLICKGRTLEEYNSTLSDLGVSSKSKLMMIGKKNNLEEEKHIATIENISKRTNELWKKFEEIKNEISGLSKGFIDDEKTTESYKRLTKSVQGLAEGFMGNVEALDALELTTDFPVAKEKRKSLIKRINEYLTAADNEADRLKELLSAKS